MIIERLSITRPFRYFWLKTVRDVDLSQHCAKCLKGRTVPHIPTFGDRHDIQLEDCVYYLCGVSQYFVWKDNFHLAFRPKIGGIIDITDEEKGVYVRIKDAEPLPISESFVDESDPHYHEDSYRTCRNWQFAHFFAKHLLVKQKKLFD